MSERKPCATCDDLPAMVWPAGFDAPMCWPCAAKAIHRMQTIDAPEGGSVGKGGRARPYRVTRVEVVVRL